MARGCECIFIYSRAISPGHHILNLRQSVDKSLVTFTSHDERHDEML